MGAVSRYDYEYLRYYTGVKNLKLISSFSGFYTKGHKYKPTIPEILVMSRTQLKTELESYQGNISFKGIHSLYPRYSLDNLVSHRAIIFEPYSVMSFKFTEYYSLSIPLFVPSATYFRKAGSIGSDRTSTSPPYCNKDKDLWHKMPRHLKSANKYNPNAEFGDDPESAMFWLQFSDFYDWPHVQFFHDVEDLVAKLASTDFVALNRAMVKENEIRKNVLLGQWCEIIKNIPDFH